MVLKDLEIKLQVLAFLVKCPTMFTLMLSYRPSFNKKLTRNKMKSSEIQRKKLLE